MEKGYEWLEKMIDCASFSPKWKRFLVANASLPKPIEEIVGFLVNSPLDILARSIKETDKKAEELAREFEDALKGNDDLVSEAFFALFDAGRKVFLAGGGPKEVMNLKEFDKFFEVIDLLKKNPGKFPVKTFESAVCAEGGRWALPLEKGVKVPEDVTEFMSSGKLSQNSTRTILFFPDHEDWKGIEAIIKDYDARGRADVREGIFFSPSLRKYAVSSCYLQHRRLQKRDNGKTIGWDKNHIYWFRWGFFSATRFDGKKAEYGDSVVQTALENYFLFSKGKVLPIEIRKDPGDFVLDPSEQCIAEIERYRQFFSPTLNIKAFSECRNYSNQGWKPERLGAFGLFYLVLEKDRIVIYAPKLSEFF